MALGIPFEAGAACSYDPRSGTLMVRNTADHHGLLAQLLSEPPPDGPGLVRLDYSIYSMQPADARAALAGGGESGGVWKRVKQRAAENGAVLERSASLLARSGMVQKLQQVGGRAWAGGGGAVEVVGGHPAGRELPAEGFQLDVEPVARRDGALWDVSARMSLREGKGLLPLGDGLPAVAWEDVRELAGSQTVRVGVHSFVGMFNPPDQTGVGPDPGPRKAWMVFVVAAPEKR